MWPFAKNLCGWMRARRKEMTLTFRSDLPWMHAKLAASSLGGLRQGTGSRTPLETSRAATKVSHKPAYPHFHKTVISQFKYFISGCDERFEGALLPACQSGCGFHFDSDVSAQRSSQLARQGPSPPAPIFTRGPPPPPPTERGEECATVGLSA